MRMFVTFVVVVVIAVMICRAADADKAKDRAECTDQLAGLATCLPYVGGDAKAPTPDCCNGLKQLLKTSKKCLCVIVRDRNDPELGLNINATLALGLPSVCHAPANVSQCPALLHLNPNSPEAQVFYQFGNSSSHIVGAPASAPSPSGGSSAEGSPTSGIAGGTTSSNATGTGTLDRTNVGHIIAGFVSMWLLRCS